MKKLPLLFGLFALITGGYYKITFLAIIGLCLLIWGAVVKDKKKK